MSFSFNGGIITQTGTDADLSGLTGVTSLTTFSDPKLSGEVAVGGNTEK